jgi:hypothetical protein
VPLGTANPVGPAPVRSASSVGATVSVLVKALSTPVVAGGMMAIADQIILTVFDAWSFGCAVWPRR